MVLDKEEEKDQKNVLDVDYDKDQIISAVNKQLSVNKYNKDILFGDGKAGDKILKC